MIKRSSILVSFGIVLVFYAGTYWWLSHRQSHRGPWEILFTNRSGQAELAVTQPALGISNLVLRFPEQAVTNGGLVRFDRPQPALPFGRVIFDDLMFLPGTVTLDLFGHEIELLPRTLVVDRREIPWRSDDVITLWRTNQLAPELRTPPKKQRFGR